MKKIFILLIIVANIDIKGQAQSQPFFLMDKLIMADTIYYYSVVDNIEVKANDLSQIFINGNLMDTAKYIRKGNPFIYRQNIYFNPGKYFAPQKDVNTPLSYIDATKIKIMYSVPTGKTTNYEFIFEHGIQMVPYMLDDKQIKIYLFDPETREKTLFADFWSEVEIRKMETGEQYTVEWISDILFINSTCAIVTITGDYDFRYFLVNGLNNFKPYDKRSMLNARKSDEQRKVYTTYPLFVSENGEYIKEQYSYDSDKSSRSISAACIMDRHFNYIGDALPNNGEVGGDINVSGGVNIQNDKIKNYFLRSQTDTKDTIVKRRSFEIDYKRVIVPYKFNPVLEMAMYKAYENNLLTQNDIKGLEKYELSILRNLIFAKYNYAFKSEFYQAYFNLFEFYGDYYKRNARVKDVSNKLTEADKTNLKLIQDAESKLIKK
jgi:hypothetical protein